MAAVRAHWGAVAMTLRWSPEWPFAVAVALAWIVVLAAPDGHGVHAPPGHEHHGHPHGSVLAALPGWALMSVAMMVPVALPAVRHVGMNSIRGRRYRAMAVYASVYVAIWVGFGLAAIAAYRLIRASFALDDRATLTLVLGLAAAWQLTRAKRRAVLSCKRTVALPPVGWRADRGCARFAVAQATRCLRSCWALMVVMTVVGHASLVWMAGITVLIAIEEMTLAGRRLLAPFGAVLGAAALAVAAGV
jgi:predicted metal-binding membrane protein